MADRAKIVKYRQAHWYTSPIVTLQGGPTNVDYRGFMIQRRLAADGSIPVGAVSNPSSDPDYQTQCNSNVSPKTTC